jgi:hypothetical protein
MIDMTYDPEADAVYVYLARGKTERQEERVHLSMTWMRRAVSSVSRSYRPAKFWRPAIGSAPGRRVQEALTPRSDGAFLLRLA